MESSQLVAHLVLDTTIKSRLGFLNITPFIPLVPNLEVDMQLLSIQVIDYIKPLLSICIENIVKELSDRIQLRSASSVIGIHLDRLRNNFPNLFKYLLILILIIQLYRNNQPPSPKQ